jgi:hypothetical protein
MLRRQSTGQLWIHQHRNSSRSSACVGRSFTEIGRQTFDGRGNTDATATLSANGNIVSGVTLQGTYQVNSDCTGSMTLFVSPISITSHADFVIDDDGEELRAIITDAGIVEGRVYKKQFSRGRRD